MSTKVHVDIAIIKLACENYKKMRDRDLELLCRAEKISAMHGFWNYIRFRRDPVKIANFFDNKYKRYRYSWEYDWLVAASKVCSSTAIELELHYAAWVCYYQEFSSKPADF